MLGFQRLDVYQSAIQFVGLTARIGEALPKGQSDLFDQLRRAAQSVPLNIAEGSGKFNRDAKRSTPSHAAPPWSAAPSWTSWLRFHWWVPTI